MGYEFDKFITQQRLVLGALAETKAHLDGLAILAGFSVVSLNHAERLLAATAAYLSACTLSTERDVVMLYKVLQAHKAQLGPIEEFVSREMQSILKLRAKLEAAGFTVELISRSKLTVVDGSVSVSVNLHDGFVSLDYGDADDLRERVASVLETELHVGERMTRSPLARRLVAEHQLSIAYTPCVVKLGFDRDWAWVIEFASSFAAHDLTIAIVRPTARAQVLSNERRQIVVMAVRELMEAFNIKQRE